MCDEIFTVDGDVSTVAEMVERGWTITDDDIHPSYADSSWTPSEAEGAVCLCPVDVEKVLDRHGVQYERDPFGYAVAPLKGHW